MRSLTADELARLATAEKRRKAAAHFQIRLSAVIGTIGLMDDLLASIAEATPRARARFEPRLLERKAQLLRARIGLAPTIRFFDQAYRQVIDPILGETS